MTIRNKSVYPIKIEPIFVCTFQTFDKLRWSYYYPFGLNINSTSWVNDKSHKRFMRSVQLECDKISNNYK